MDKQSAPLRDPQAKFPVQEPEAKAKRTYQPPTITDYGRLSEITQSGFGTGTEVGSSFFT
ncbi:MAG: lasso RiPP family leader peptide-containing protein [Chloroflexi bacterium]|nr:lasso RiPP family leader peptide-containing protein [Chloroflexota bacterium]